MTKVVGTWKSGFGFFKANAQTVAEEISSIGEKITKQQIVDKARDEGTELHKCFEWDDTVAAEKYRVVQAGEILRCLVIKRTEEQIEQNKPEIRFFHNVRTETGEGTESVYEPIRYIMKNEDEYQKLLKQALAELHAFKMKYHALSELDYILSLID